MDEMMMNIKAMAANNNESIASLARRAGIDPEHLYSVSCGRATLTGEDLIRLSEATGVPEKNIQRVYKTP